MGFKDKIVKASKTLIDTLEPKEATPGELFEVTTYVSTTYFTDNVEKLISKMKIPVNNNYIMEKAEKSFKVYKYRSIQVPVNLEFEPKNEHDSNAIKVTVPVGLENIQLGYIKREENIQIGSYLKDKRVYNINATLFGGPIKVLSGNGPVDQSERYKVAISMLIRK